MANKILVIDDEEKLRKLLSRILELEKFEVSQAGNAQQAIKKLEHQDFDVVICDVKLPDVNGVEFIPEIKNIQPFAEVILLTAYGNIPDGVKSIKNGAFDYITKGDDNNKIIPLVNKALVQAALNKKCKQDKTVINVYNFENILGRSESISNAISLAKKVSQTDTTVLLLGETGTGKEIFASSIKQAGIRKDKPFVAVNCSAFSKDLLESELFGHSANAFTGAGKDKKGLFSEAHTGTLFLDEIGEMALDLQAKLLRVLENGEFFRIGETKPLKVDVRIIAATNRNLEEEIEKGNFRSDLYYRISVFTINLPPLRERGSDIILLAKNFIQLFSTKNGNKRTYTMSHEFLKILEQNNWKGNIRELKNIIERSIILADENILDIECLPLELQQKYHLDKKEMSTFSMAGIEKLHIQKVLRYTHSNKAEAARLLEIGIATLYRKIEEYKI